MKQTHLIATAMRNEGPYLLEWVAYHLSLGVDHVLVFSDNCRDGTDKMLRRLENMGLVTHRRNPAPEGRKGGHRPRAARRVLRDPVGLAHDWSLFLDPNEFLNLRAEHISAVTERGVPLTLPRRIFGSAGVTSFHDGFLTETFRRAASGLSPDAPRVLHRSTVPADADTPDATLGQINTYLRTREAFLLDAHLTGKTAARFNALDRNEVSDRSIQPKLAAMADIYDDLMGDHKLARLHNRSVEWHRAQIQALLASDSGQAMFDAMQPKLELFPGLRQRLSS